MRWCSSVECRFIYKVTVCIIYYYKVCLITGLWERGRKTVFRLARRLPQVKNMIKKEIDKVCLFDTFCVPCIAPNTEFLLPGKDMEFHFHFPGLKLMKLCKNVYTWKIFKLWVILNIKHLTPIWFGDIRVLLSVMLLWWHSSNLVVLIKGHYSVMGVRTSQHWLKLTTNITMYT